MQQNLLKELSVDLNQNKKCDLIVDLIHEIRNYNRIIDKNATRLSYETQKDKNRINLKNIKSYSDDLLDMSYKIKFWLDYISYQLHSDLMQDVSISEQHLYRVFDKAIRHFRRLSRRNELGIKINFSGNSNSEIQGNEIIAILPYLLIENAMKYSNKGAIIDIEFIEFTNSIQIKINSIGPHIEEERNMIFEKGFRSKNAQLLTDSGAGRGLSFAKFIVDFHHGDIKINFGIISF